LAILNGEAAKTLNDAKGRYLALKAQADALESKVRNEADPARRAAAGQSLERAKGELEGMKGYVNQAVEQYNSAATEIGFWSVGMFAPEQVTGLAALPLAGVVLGLVAAGVAVAAVYALSDLVRSIRGQEVKTKGFIEQTADLLGQGTGVLVELRNWVPIVLGLGALGAGIYFLSKIKGRGKGEKVSSAPTAALAAGKAG
jgi:hypothetical protein